MVEDLRVIHEIKQVTVELNDQHVKSKSPNFVEGTIEFLVDTGSSVNIIRLSALTSKTKLVKGNNVLLRGIRNILEESIDIVEISIEIGSKVFEKIRLYIVKNDMPLIKAGILGKPFFESQDTTINMPYGCRNHTLTLGGNIKIPPRVEYIMGVSIEGTTVGHNETIIIQQGEIQEQLFVGNVINTVKNGHVLINVINLSNDVKIIKPMRLTDFKYDTYKEELVMNINKISNNKILINPERITKLKEVLRSEHLNKEEIESIEQICSDFADIFHLNGDKLTNTMSIEHEIRTPVEHPPIYQRQYRLPHCQRSEINKQIEQMESDGIIEPSDSPWNSPSC